MFEIVSDRMPTCWVTGLEDGRLTLAPQEWQRPGLWDNFFDHVPDAVAEYDRLKARSSRRHDRLTKSGDPVLPSVCLGSQAFGLLFLVGDVPQALLQAGDLTKPPHPLGLSEALAVAGLDLQQPGFLS
ncbi:hypothetical protein ABT404_08140 [Streptomyces hyaluromycini]|uniref:Uncharacterized protein n=1 Tax=Streptomyces hyaluromycini TaxID=1377993 RepID=A0ABV1WRG5_9ACTN